jgi:hypothetical protein
LSSAVVMSAWCALAVWPNHWANVLQAKSAAKVARKAATEAVKKPAAGEAVAGTKPADDDGDVACDGPVPVASCVNVATEANATFFPPVWVDEQLWDEMRFQNAGPVNCTSLQTHLQCAQTLDE